MKLTLVDLECFSECFVGGVAVIAAETGNSPPTFR